MHLSTKFIVVTLPMAVMTALLILVGQIGLRRINKASDYQKLVRSAQIETIGVSDFLDSTSLFPFETTDAKNEFDFRLNSLTEKLSSIKVGFSFFPEDLLQKASHLSSSSDRFFSETDSISSFLSGIDLTDLSTEIQSIAIQKGIQKAYEAFPSSPEVARISESLASLKFVLPSVRSGLSSLKFVLPSVRSGLSSLSSALGELDEDISSIIASRVFYFRFIMISLLIIFFVAIIFILYFSDAKTSTDINRALSFSSSLSKKDFTQSVESKGGRDIKILINNLKGIADEMNDFFVIVKKATAKAISSGYSINDSAVSTTAAATEINKNIASITKQFEQINDSVLRAVEAIEEINSQIKTLVSDNTENTEAIGESSKAISDMSGILIQIRESADSRSKSAEDMRAFVDDGDKKISASAEMLSQVMKQLDEVMEVITIINSVAEQTRLLSMNAEIESAHAGEYGKGFSVVAEQIRRLSESTGENALRINDAITGVIKNVTKANESSHSALEAFSKVSSCSHEVIDSFDMITKGIDHIDNQARQITEKAESTALSAQKINACCTNLAEHQETVAAEITSISALFNVANADIHEINTGTQNIVERMKSVSVQSKDSYKNMTDLENALEDFKTTGDDSEDKQEISEVAIENIISPELRAQLEADMGGIGEKEVSGKDEIEFDLDNVEEY